MSKSEASTRREILAAIAVTALLVPQATAYAMLAGLSPITGLACAAAATLAYAPLGTSRYLAVGPVALTSLLVASGLEGMAVPGTARYADLALALSWLVAMALGVLALLRAGFIANFLGQPAIIGFNAAGGVLTAASQIRGFFGLPASASAGATAENPWPMLMHLGDASILATLLGCGTLVTLVLLPRIGRKVPAPLVACVLGGLVTWVFGLVDHGVVVVGEIPRTLPVPRWPDVDWSDLRALIPTVVSLVVVGYGSSVAVAKGLAAKDREQIDPDRELWGIAAANAASGLVGAFPVSAGLSRTMVAHQAGGKTRLVAALAALGVVLAVAIAAEGFAVLPMAVLSGIVVHAASGLIDRGEVREVFRAGRSDTATMVATFVVTMVLGLVVGLAAGLVVALVLFVHRTASPHTAELGRIPGSMVYRNATRFTVEVCPQVGILRVDAPLYFANARFLEDRVFGLVASRPQLRLVALDCSGISDIDATATAALRNLTLALRERGNDLHLVGPIGPVRDVLARTGVLELLGDKNLHRTIIEAAPSLMARLDRSYCEQQCRVSAFPECTLIPRGALASPRSEASKFSPQI